MSASLFWRRLSPPREAMSSVLITGARSKIVQPVVRHFIDAGWDLHLLTRSSQLKPHPNITMHQLDLSEGCRLDIAPDVIIHAAGTVPYNYSRPITDSELLQSNVYGYLSLLNFAVEAGVKKLVFLSSTDVYGSSRGGEFLSEQNVCMPDNFYGFTKLACERMSATYRHVRQMDITILRIGPVFGPGMEESLAVYRLIANALRGIEIKLMNPDSVLSLISVRKVADAIIRSCFAPPATVNIASRPVPLRSFLEQAYAARGFPPRFLLTYDKAKETNLRFDLSTAERVLGWTPDEDLRGVFTEMASSLPAASV